MGFLHQVNHRDPLGGRRAHAYAGSASAHRRPRPALLVSLGRVKWAARSGGRSLPTWGETARPAAGRSRRRLVTAGGPVRLQQPAAGQRDRQFLRVPRGRLAIPVGLHGRVRRIPEGDRRVARAAGQRRRRDERSHLAVELDRHPGPPGAARGGAPTRVLSLQVSSRVRQVLGRGLPHSTVVRMADPAPRVAGRRVHTPGLAHGGVGGDQVRRVGPAEAHGPSGRALLWPGSLVRGPAGAQRPCGRRLSGRRRLTAASWSGLR